MIYWLLLIFLTSLARPDLVDDALSQQKPEEFEAEMDRLMKLIINSLYQNRDIFIRELVSNANDALDKMRLIAITNSSALGSLEDLRIDIRVDSEAKTITIADSGIGMTQQHLRDFLGTVARSGTFRFAEKHAESSNFADLIGQFGVGLYSAFLVADRVLVVSKHNDDPSQHIWQSDGRSFRVVEDPRGNTLARGTELILYLKEDAEDYLNPGKIERIVRQYSQFVGFPIFVDSKHVNDVEAVWRRKNVSDQDYQTFFKALSGRENSEFLAKNHFTIESEVSCSCLVFVPKQQDPLKHLARHPENNLRLYVKRVLISSFNNTLMPEYLRFVYAVIDSDDFPLNVSRETVQHSRVLVVIMKKIVRKILDLLGSLNDLDYDSFWREFGTNIKHGLIEDTQNRLRLAKLLRFYSSWSPKNYTSLLEYIERMPETQPPTIFYVSARSVQEAERSAFAEQVKDRGFEVLYLVDAIDEFALQSLTKFEDKSFQNVAKDGLNLTSTESDDEEKEFEPLLKWLSDNFSEKVLSAHISNRLVRSCMVFVAAQWGYDGNMQRIAMAQAYQKIGGDLATTHFASMKRKLEINPKHPLVLEMLRMVKQNPADPKLKETAQILVETALLRSGYELDDTKSYADQIEDLVSRKIGVSKFRQFPPTTIDLLSLRRSANKTSESKKKKRKPKKKTALKNRRKRSSKKRKSPKTPKEISFYRRFLRWLRSILVIGSSRPADFETSIRHSPPSRQLLSAKKVGFAYRYRISRMEKALAPDLVENPVLAVDKPRVGYEYRYRISRFLEGRRGESGDGNWLANLLVFNRCVQWAEVPVVVRKSENIRSGSVGYQFRYRRSRKQAAEQLEKTSVKPPAKSIKHGSVGYEYRYRLSRKLKKKEEPEIKDDDSSRIKVPLSAIYPPELQKAGYEFRYRRSRKMEALGIDPQTVIDRKTKYLQENHGLNDIKPEKTNRIEQSSLDPKSLPIDYSKLTKDEKKCGYEHRYRISRKFARKIPEYLRGTYDNCDNMPPWWRNRKDDTENDYHRGLLMEAVSLL